MKNLRTLHCISVIATVLSLFISGCVSVPPPQATPAPTGTPIPAIVTPIPTTPIPATPVPTPVPVAPAVRATSYPGSVNGDTNFTIQWEVSGGIPGNISNTAVFWGFKSGSANISDYPRMSSIQTGKTPEVFSAELKAPAGGSIYFRAHAIVDGVDLYSNEYQITIIASMGGGGGY